MNNKVRDDSMSFSLEDIRKLLIKENLLKEFVSVQGWHLDAPEQFVFKK